MDSGVSEKMGAHGARLDGHDREFRELREDIGEIKESLKSLEQIASMGKGALWTALKLGALASVIVGILVWLYQTVLAPLLKLKGGW